jgi:ATP-binding cassette subfamily C (CFTR/MRP) protein 4
VFFGLQLLRLSKLGASHAATGRIVNLMSNDVCRFDYAPQHIGFLIITPLQAVITTYFLWTIVGPSSMVGVGFILLQTLPVQSE